MIAINWSDYNESGCVECGCAKCSSKGTSGPTTIVTCSECNTKFLVVNDKLEFSSIGFDKNGVIDELLNPWSITKEVIEKKFIRYSHYLESNGIYYPIPQIHPRKGIPKHDFVERYPDEVYDIEAIFEHMCSVISKIKDKEAKDLMCVMDGLYKDYVSIQNNFLEYYGYECKLPGFKKFKQVLIENGYLNGKSKSAK